jgi:penicillin-binding protein 2
MASKLSEITERAKFAGVADRLSIIQYVLLGLVIVMGFRLWSLQMINHEKYIKEAENNRIRLIPIIAPRGAILDRNGKIIVDNRPSLSVILNREEMRTRGRNPFELVDELIANGLTLDRETVRARLEGLRNQAAFYPVLLKENVGPADVAWVEARRLEYPELDVMEHPQRRYPFGDLAAHVLGYVAEISKTELAKPEFKDYRPGDLIGKYGIEQQYDRFLRGRDGYRRVIVDSTGHEVGEIERVDPLRGNDIKLTIDLDLQRAAEDQLMGRRGVVTAMNPQTGEILAMVSHPAFDPALFSQRITSPEGKAEYRALLNDPDKPLINRAIQGIYPTGSTWKILMTAASLEEGVITPEHSTFACGRGLQVGNRFARCMGSHGFPDIHRAVVVSCDGYFYRLGLKLGIERIEKWVNRFAVGRRTGIDLPNETAGLVPSRALKAKVNPKDPKWKEFDTVLASIGQGSVVITPLQLVRMVSGIAMGGVFPTPHVFKEVVGAGISYQAEEPLVVPLSKTALSAVRSAMWGVVNEGGTGTAARVEGLDVCGKTGTAQVVSTEKATGDFKDHAWFVSFAPRDNPRIAVVALVENVGQGGHFSAPVAKVIYETYKTKYVNAQPASDVADAPVAPPAVETGEKAHAAAPTKTAATR